MLTLQTRSCSRLAGKASNDALVLRALGLEHLDRDILIELEMRRANDTTHPAFAKHTLDAVLPAKNRACL